MGLIAAALGGLFIVYMLPSVLFVVLMLSSRPLVKEIQRVESPDHEVEVVVVESNPGALEPFTYDVYLTKPGSKKLGNSVLGAIGKNDLNFSWISPRLLEISYSDACIVSFRNHWENTVSPYVGGEYDVEIRLKPPQDAIPRPFCA